MSLPRLSTGWPRSIKIGLHFLLCANASAQNKPQGPAPTTITVGKSSEDEDVFEDNVSLIPSISGVTNSILPG